MHEVIAAARRTLAAPGRWLALLFLILATPTGLMLVAITPLGQVPDEFAHALRADAVRHGEFLAHRMPWYDAQLRPRMAAGVDADTGVHDAMETLLPGAMTRQAIAARAGTPWHHRLQFVDLTTIAVYAPVFYLPTAVTFGVMAHLQIGPASSVLVARYVNLALFLLLGASALLVARRGAGVVFCVVSLPMTLALAASLNPDGLLIGTACLGLALLTRGGGGRDPARLAAMALLVLMVKPPYGVLAVLLLLPVRWSWRGWARGLASVALVLLPGLLWALYNQAYVAEPMFYPEQPAGPLWIATPGEIFRDNVPATQIKVLLAEPARFLTLPWLTMANDVWVVRQTIGVLGWLTLVLPDWYYRLWIYAGVAALLADGLQQDPGAPRIGLADRALLVLAALTGLWVIYIAQYLLWTPIGQEVIVGVQGRYFLPLLPLAGLAVSGLFQAPIRVRAALMVLPVVALSCGLVRLPLLLVQAFWISP